MNWYKISKKEWDPNPWAVCNKSTGGKKKDPEKFERCVQDVKKKQNKKEAQNVHTPAMENEFADQQQDIDFRRRDMGLIPPRRKGLSLREKRERLRTVDPHMSDQEWSSFVDITLRDQDLSQRDKAERLKKKIQELGLSH